jgi:hypothetical protein
VATTRSDCATRFHAKAGRASSRESRRKVNLRMSRSPQPHPHRHNFLTMNRLVKVLGAVGIVSICGCGIQPISPILSMAPPPEDMAKIVMVCPNRGIGASVELVDQIGGVRNLHPGGSVVFDVAPGIHRLKLEAGANFVPGVGINVIEAPVPVAAGETLFLTLDPSGFYGSAGPDSVRGPVTLTLRPVTREKAARIALY